MVYSRPADDFDRQQAAVAAAVVASVAATAGRDVVEPGAAADAGYDSAENFKN